MRAIRFLSDESLPIPFFPSLAQKKYPGGRSNMDYPIVYQYYTFCTTGHLEFLITVQFISVQKFNIREDPP